MFNMNEIETLKKLVEYNTIRDKENIEIINYISNYLKDLGFKIEKKKKYLIMSIGNDYKLGFIGHSDTVDTTDGWLTNPFTLTQKDDLLYGLGACDMKGGIAAFLQALKEIDLYKLKKGIKIYITYDEEISFKGIKYEVPYTTMNIGIINGGDSINSVSDKCESYIDFRVVQKEHINILKDKVKELSKKYQAICNVDIEIVPIFNKISFIENQDTANFMTEASFVEGKRIILGPGDVTAHEPNEHISIKSLQYLVKQYKELIDKICNE